MVTKDMVEKKEYHRIEETAHKVMELLGKEEGSEVKTNITIHLDREADPIRKVHSKMFPEIFGADTYKAKKVVTLGEIMLRLEPDACRRFVQAEEYQVVYGGSEANVAVSLANFGIPSTFVTKLPDNDIAQAGINYLRAYGVDTSHIVRGGNRMGIYFIEKGASQRPSKVVYDRAGSSMSEAFDLDLTVNTKRNTRSASDNDFSAMLYQNKRAYRSQKYSMHIVDRVGGGDAFAAGLIYSQIKGYEPKDAIEFAVVAACLKHSIEGDSYRSRTACIRKC